MADIAEASLLGQRVRRLRVQSGLGVRELAREIGVSASSLSELENNRRGISLKRLQLVADYFGVHISDLLSEAAAPGTATESVEIVRRSFATTPAVRRGRHVNYQVPGRGGDHLLQPYLLSFEPGGGYERDQIAHPGEEFCYVLAGAVNLVYGNELHRLEQGDIARFRTETPHAFRNASSVGIAVVIGAATPPW